MILIFGRLCLPLRSKSAGSDRTDSSNSYNIMAIPIREIPILTGQSALDFIKAADALADVPVPHLSEEDEQKLREIDEAYKSFVW